MLETFQKAGKQPVKPERRVHLHPTMGSLSSSECPLVFCNALATFQQLMQNVLSRLEYTSSFIYLDDMLVASKMFEDHLTHLCEVFS